MDHFLALPRNRELAKHQLTTMEWSVLSDVQVVLEVRAASESKRYSWNLTWPQIDPSSRPASDV